MKRLFGNNIVPSCSYCEYSKTEGNQQYCIKNKAIKNGTCRKFKYNPIMRTPHSMAPLKQYEPDNFIV